MLSGCTVYGGRSLRGGISQHPIQPISLSHTQTAHLRARIPVHTLTVCIYSTSSMLILTQVRTNFLVCCAFLMVPSRSCVNILSDCQKMCQVWKRGWSYTAQDLSAPLLHTPRYVFCRLTALPFVYIRRLFPKRKVQQTVRKISW